MGLTEFKDDLPVVKLFIMPRLVHHFWSAAVGLDLQNLIHRARFIYIKQLIVRWMDEQRKERETISPLFCLLICYRIDFEIFLLALKAVNGLAASYLSEFLHLHVPAGGPGAASHLLLDVPKTRLKTRVRSNVDPGRFKSPLKTPSHFKMFYPNRLLFILWMLFSWAYIAVQFYCYL